MPSWLAPVWLDQSVRQDMTRWLRSSQSPTVGIAPDPAARRSTSYPTPSSWRKTSPGAPRPRRGARAQLPAPAPVGEPVEPAAVRLVVADGQGRGRGGRHGGHHRGDDHGGLGRHLPASVGDQVERDQQQRAVEEEDEQPQQQGRHQQQRPDEQRPHQRAQQPEGAGAPGGRQRDAGDTVTVVGLEPEVRQDPGQGEHGERGHRPHEDHPHQCAARRAPPSAPHSVPPFVVHCQRRTATRTRPGDTGGARTYGNRRSGRVTYRRSPRSAWTAGGALPPSSRRCTSAPPARRSPAGSRAARTPR